MALTATGIIEIASNVNDFEVREKAIDLFIRAFKANPRNPLTLRYLADHYFLIKKYDYCKEFTEVGLFILQSK
jgi:hypothetical protein